MNSPHKLNEIIISITNRCNLRCAMCQIPSRPPDGEMRTEELKALIADATALYPNAIVFSGGEPLLRKDLYELIAFAGRHRLNTCLTSNGTLLDDEAAARLAACGMGVLNISIEGPQEVHDTLRGKGNYQLAREALAHLARHKIEATIATTVCRQNYRYLPDVMMLASAAGATTVKFQPFSPIFLTDRASANDFFLPPGSLKDVEDVMERVLALAEAHKIATNPKTYLQRLPGYLCGQKMSAPSTCAALTTSCPISAQGDVHPCWVFADKVLGNVKKDRLSGIWNSSRHDRMRRHLLEDECSGCFMSCYDANLGKDGLAASFIVRAHKLKKPKFYKRLYFRSFQYARYMSGKIFRRVSLLALGKRRIGPADAQGVIREIRNAKKALTSKLKELA